jgi:hypothetical protein
LGAGSDPGSDKPGSDSYITTRVKAEPVRDKESKTKDIQASCGDGGFRRAFRTR